MDIPSTVLALSGITTKTPMVGRNLLKLPKGTKEELLCYSMNLCI